MATLLFSDYEGNTSKKREISAQERELLRNNLNKCTLNISLPDDIANDKRTAQERVSRFGSLEG